MVMTDVLAKVPLFAGLDAEAIKAIAGFSFQKTFQAGELIVEEGRTGNGMFIIVSGRAEVIKGLNTTRPRTVANLGAGEPIGEMALLGEWPRTATVRAVETDEGERIPVAAVVSNADAVRTHRELLAGHPAARVITCQIRGWPAISARTFPGKRCEAMRAWMIATVRIVAPPKASRACAAPQAAGCRRAHRRRRRPGRRPFP